ncbi:MAG: hypothetical protein H7A30_08025 [Thermotogae bacterium]|nr:hypothetical protein [Thermotogota bacterium]
MRRKIGFSLLIIISMLIFNGCVLFNDTQPPVFIEKPYIVLSGTQGVPNKLGEVVTFKLNIEDNRGISKVELSTSNSATPFETLYSGSGRTKINDYVSFNLVPSNSMYNVNIQVTDTNGNTNILPVSYANDGGVVNFISKDNIAPVISGSPALIKNFKSASKDVLTFSLKDIGFGFQKVTAKLYYNGREMYSKTLNISDYPDFGNFYVQNDSYWEVSGTAYMELASDIPPLNYDLRIYVSDKEGNMPAGEYLPGNINLSGYASPEDNLFVEIDTVKNVVINSNYNITIKASSDNYITNIMVDGRSVYPGDNRILKNVILTVPQKAPSVVSDVPVKHKIVISTTSGHVYNYTREVTVKRDNSPVLGYFGVYKKDGENYVSAAATDVYLYDTVYVRFKITDDIKLKSVKMFYGSEGKYNEYSVFSESPDGTDYNEYLEINDSIIVDSNNFKIGLVAEDSNGNVISYKNDSSLVKTVTIKDETIPAISSIRILNTDSGRNISPEGNVFKVAKNNEVKFKIRVERKPSEISSVIITLKDENNVFMQNLSTVKSETGFDFQTDNSFVVPDKTNMYFDIKVVDANGNIREEKGYEMRIFDDASLIYIPKITTDQFNKIILPGEPIGPFSGSFSDDGFLKKTYIKVLKKNDDGSVSPVKNDLGIVDPTTLISEGGDENPLNVSYSQLSLNTWSPYTDGAYVIRFFAQNTENYIAIKDVEVDVRNITIQLVNPPDKNIYNYGGRIDLEVKTIDNSQNFLYIYFDSDNDGFFDEDEKTFEKELSTDDISPEGVIYDYVDTTDYSVFPNMGNYMFRVKRVYKGFETYDNINITIDDITEFDFAEDGFVIRSDTDINNEVDGGYYDSTGRIYYIPVKFDGTVNTSPVFNFSIEGYSKLTEVIFTVNGKKYTMNYLSQSVNTDNGKRVYNYNATVSNQDINPESNTVIIQMIAKAGDPANDNRYFYNDTNFSFNMVAIGTNKPQITNFDLSVQRDGRTFRYDETDYSAQLNDYIKNTVYNMSFSNILFTDLYKLSGIEFYWNNVVTKVKTMIATKNIKIESQSSTNPSDFNINSVDFKTPSEQGRFELVINLKNRNYRIVEESGLPDYMNILKDYTSAKIIIPVNITEVLDIITNIVFDYDSLNNLGKGVIPARTFYLNLIVQNKDYLDRSSIGAQIVQNGVTYDLSIIGEPADPNKNDPDKNLVLAVSMGDSVKDGDAKIIVNLSNTNGKSFTVSRDTVIDIIQNYPVPKPVYDSSQNSIYVEINASQAYDIKDAYFEFRDKGIVQKASLNTETLLSKNMKISMNTVDFYPGSYDVRVVLIDQNGNYFINNEYENITIKSSGSSVYNLNNFGIFRGIIALNPADSIYFYNDNGFKDIMLETPSGIKKVSGFEASDEEVPYDILADYPAVAENVSGHLVINMMDNLSETPAVKDVYLYKYTADILSIDTNTDIFSNKNSGLKTFNVNIPGNIKVRAVSVKSTDIFQNDYIYFMRNKGTVNSFEIVLPEIKTGIEESKNINIDVFDISGRKYSFVKPLNIDTKKPVYNSFSLSNATEISPGVYTVNYDQRNNVNINWNITDSDIDDSKGEVSVIINNQYINITSSKKSGTYSLGTYKLLKDNEYEIYSVAKDSTGNITSSSKLILKIID